jgi:hypothetical protein
MGGQIDWGRIKFDGRFLPRMNRDFAFSTIVSWAIFEVLLESTLHECKLPNPYLSGRVALTITFLG